MKKIVFIHLLISMFATSFMIHKGALASSFPVMWEVSSEKLFVFDPKILQWAAYNSWGFLINTGRASGGKDYCADIQSSCRTITGTFKVYRKGKKDCVSGKFPLETEGGARMPYCMFFRGGYAIHGSNDVPGYNASHGCIRVTPEAAEWLSEEFIDIGTRVQVLSYPN